MGSAGAGRKCLVLTSVVCLVVILLFCTQATATSFLYFSQDRSVSGLYTLDMYTGAATFVGTSGVTSATVGLAPSSTDSLLYGSKPFGLLHINSDGSGSTLLGSVTIEGLAYDPVANICYGSWWNNSGFFASINPATGGVIANLAAAPDDVEGLAFHNGTVYGLAGWGASPRGDLWAYSVAGDSWSLIGSTGIAFNECGLAYDTFQNVLYGIGTQDANLYMIDPLTAATSVIGSTGLLTTGGGLAFVDGYVPEPCTLLLFSVGGAGMLVLRRIRKRMT